MAIKLVLITFISLILVACGSDGYIAEYFDKENSGKAYLGEFFLEFAKYSIIAYEGLEHYEAYEIAYPQLPEPVDFILLEVDVLVEEGICKDHIELIFRHFQAINDGDRQAFRKTLANPSCNADFVMQERMFFQYFYEHEEYFRQKFADSPADFVEYRINWFYAPYKGLRAMNLQIEKIARYGNDDYVYLVLMGDGHRQQISFILQFWMMWSPDYYLDLYWQNNPAHGILFHWGNLN